MTQKKKSNKRNRFNGHREEIKAKILKLIKHSTKRAAAEAVGIHYDTLGNWTIKGSPGYDEKFHLAFNKARAKDKTELIGYLWKEAENGSVHAMKTLGILCFNWSFKEAIDITSGGGSITLPIVKHKKSKQNGSESSEEELSEE